MKFSWICINCEKATSSYYIVFFYDKTKVEISKTQLKTGVLRICIFTIDADFWKIWVSWLNHIKIPLSQFW